MIKYSSDLKWGDIFYLKCDEDQLEHCLVGINLTPGKPKLVLSFLGETVLVYECETTREPDKKKRLGIDGKPDDITEEDD